MSLEFVGDVSEPLKHDCVVWGLRAVAFDGEYGFKLGVLLWDA